MFQRCTLQNSPTENIKWFLTPTGSATTSLEQHSPMRISGRLWEAPSTLLYDWNQFKKFFKTSDDIDLLISLLQHVGLLHKCGDNKYIIPGKFPEIHDKVSWRKEEEFKEYYGRRLECEQDVDMFAPDVFPCIQMLSHAKLYVLQNYKFWILNLPYRLC